MFPILKLVILTPLMAILPGSWVTFGLPINSLNKKTKLALGATISPAVIGVQFILLKILADNNLNGEIRNITLTQLNSSPLFGVIIGIIPISLIILMHRFTSI